MNFTHAICINHLANDLWKHAVVLAEACTALGGQVQVGHHVPVWQWPDQ
jgi:hypothetical protein